MNAPMPRSYILLPLLILSVQPASAASGAALQARWKEVGRTRSGNPVFVDPKSVKRGKDGGISATIRVTFNTPVKTPRGNITASRASAMFDCGKMTFATTENATYLDEKKGTVFQSTVNKQPGYGPAIAGTFADVAMKHLCMK